MASAMVAQDAIIDGHRIVALGGFSGGDASAGAGRVDDAIASGRLRYLLAGGSASNGSREPAVFEWVRSVCTVVPAETWGGQGESGVYDCRGKAAALRAAAAAG